MPESQSSSNSNTPSTPEASASEVPSSPSLLFFFILTTLYAALTYFSDSQTTRMMWTAIYFLLLMVLQFYINLQTATAVCGGSPQYGTAAIVTFVPWTIIFGTLQAILTVFPGWLSPFANTLGYLVTRMAGLSNVLSDILKPKAGTDGPGKSVSQTTQALINIYEDNSLLINEVTPENFDSWWGKMSSAGGLFKSNAGASKTALLKLVRLKEIVAKYVWYLLTGALVSSISFNYAVSSSCDLAPSEIQRRADSLQTAAASRARAAADSPPQVYTTYE